MKNQDKEDYIYEKAIASINKETLEKLKDAFYEVDLELIEGLLKEIKENDYDEKTTILIKHIDENLESFEYDKSIELINDFF